MQHLVEEGFSVLRVLLGAVLSGLVLVLWLPLVSEILSLVARKRAIVPSDAGSGEIPKLLFLVPAHDEELLISACVRSLVDMEYPLGAYDPARSGRLIELDQRSQRPLLRERGR